MIYCMYEEMKRKKIDASCFRSSGGAGVESEFLIMWRAIPIIVVLYRTAQLDSWTSWDREPRIAKD
jgi:hypothetical protein